MAFLNPTSSARNPPKRYSVHRRRLRSETKYKQEAECWGRRKCFVHIRSK